MRIALVVASLALLAGCGGGEDAGLDDPPVQRSSDRRTVNGLFAGIGPQVGTDLELTSYKGEIDGRDATVSYSHGPEHPLLDARKVAWYREDDGVWREDACMD